MTARRRRWSAGACSRLRPANLPRPGAKNRDASERAALQGPQICNYLLDALPGVLRAEKLSGVEMGWCGSRMGRGWQGHPGHVDPRAGRLGSGENADAPGAGSRHWPVAADSALLALGLTADKERTGGESFCAVAGRRF